MEITPSQIRCLLAVLALSETYKHIESKDVAHLLGIKKSTAHRTLAILQEKELIDKEHYGDVHLFPAGIRAARTLEAWRDDITILFARQYGLSPGESAKAAIALMSELTEESLALLCHADDSMIREAAEQRYSYTARTCWAENLPTK